MANWRRFTIICSLLRRKAPLRGAAQRKKMDGSFDDEDLVVDEVGELKLQSSRRSGANEHAGRPRSRGSQVGDSPTRAWWDPKADFQGTDRRVVGDRRGLIVGA